MPANLVIPITMIELWLQPKSPLDSLIIRTEIAAPLRGVVDIGKLVLSTEVSRGFGGEWIRDYLDVHIHGEVVRKVRDYRNIR